MWYKTAVMAPQATLTQHPSQTLRLQQLWQYSRERVKECAKAKAKERLGGKAVSRLADPVPEKAVSLLLLGTLRTAVALVCTGRRTECAARRRSLSRPSAVKKPLYRSKIQRKALKRMKSMLIQLWRFRTTLHPTWRNRAM